MFVANDVGTVFVANSGMAARGEFVFREQDITGGSATNAHLWFVKGVVANDFAAFRTKNEMRRVVNFVHHSLGCWCICAHRRWFRSGSGACNGQQIGISPLIGSGGGWGTQSSEAGSVASPIEG